MRRLIALAVLGAALGLAGQAQAVRSYHPTVKQLDWARSRALAYWHVSQPPCGRETVVNAALPDSMMAEAFWSTCTIVFGERMDWRDFPTELCRYYVHELGHLVLGPTYFAASNPADPMHSPDLTNVMYSGTRQTWQQTAAVTRAVGCRLSPRRRKRHWLREREGLRPQLAIAGGYAAR